MLRIVVGVEGCMGRWEVVVVGGEESRRCLCIRTTTPLYLCLFKRVNCCSNSDGAEDLNRAD